MKRLHDSKLLSSKKPMHPLVVSMLDRVFLQGHYLLMRGANLVTALIRYAKAPPFSPFIPSIPFTPDMPLFPLSPAAQVQVSKVCQKCFRT